MSSLAHFTVYSILPRGCFSACYFALAVVGQIVEQADASTHFLCVVNRFNFYDSILVLRWFLI